MLALKKLTFAPLFLIIFIILIYQLTPLLKSYDFIFSLSLSTLIELIVISTLISLSSLFFAIFVSLSSDWKYVLPVGILASLIPLFFLDISLGLVFIVGILVSLLITYLNLDNALKSYLTFQLSALLGPSIRHLSSFLILSFCLVYFLSASKIVAQSGFQIPDSLIDTALKISSPEQTNQTDITQLLQQTGSDIIKQTVQDQIQSFLKPYLGFIPAVLAVLLFLTLQSLTSIINLLIYPLLWLTFYILEKTGFIKFVVEQRPVKKMVV